MLKRFRRHLSPPMVISVIALFVALGGGYAVAFSGSGSLQKENETGINSGYERIIVLTGIGTIAAKCAEGQVTATTVRLHNGSGQSLSLTATAAGTSSGDSTVLVSGSNREFGRFQFPEQYLVHVFPTNGSNIRPQATLMVSVFEATDCAQAQVAVEVINTEP